MRSRPALQALSFAFLATLPLVSACQTAKKIDTTTTGTSCSTKNSGCLRQNLSEVQQMIGDPQATWVEQPTPYISPSGNRMIAYIGTAQRLTCSQLRTGQAETDEALILLEPKDGKKPDSEHQNLLNVATQASGMIATELQNRCFAGIRRA